MRFLKSLLVAGFLATGGLTIAIPQIASAAEEKKCDKAGKECKDGPDCKKENCKK